MSICGFRGCDGAWGSKGSQYQNQGYSKAPKPSSPKPNVEAEAPRAASKPVASATQAVTTQKARGEEITSPQEQPSQAPQQKTSEVTSESSSFALGSLSNTFFQPADDADKKKESFWVSPSLAAWLTGQDRQAKGRDDADKVKDIIEQAVDKTGRFRPDGASDDNVSQKGIGVDIDLTTSDHAMKKLIITGEPEKRKQAIGILKELTSKCQRDSASTLIDSWQLFSDEKGDKMANNTSTGYPRFGIPSGILAGSGQGEAIGTKKESLETQAITITNLRRNLVSKYERVVKQEDDHHGKHMHEHEEDGSMKVLQLSFPLAALPVIDTPRHRFEAELKKCLNDFKKDSFAGHRVAVCYKGPHVTANVMVPVESLEDVRNTLSKNPPVVCGFKAMVPEKLLWCKICQKEHEPDKLCYKNFQTDGRFDESLTSFLGECQHVSGSSHQAWG